MRYITSITFVAAAFLLLFGCNREVSKAEPKVSVEIATSFRLPDGVSVKHFICRGDSPGHLRILWGYPKWGTHRPGVRLTENKETGTFEAGIIIVATPHSEGETEISIGFGAPDDMANGATKIVKFDDIPMGFHTPITGGSYDVDLGIGTLAGYDFTVSLDSRYFDYNGSDRVPRVAKASTD